LVGSKPYLIKKITPACVLFILYTIHCVHSYALLAGKSISYERERERVSCYKSVKGLHCPLVSRVVAEFVELLVLMTRREKSEERCGVDERGGRRGNFISLLVLSQDSVLRIKQSNGVNTRENESETNLIIKPLEETIRVLVLTRFSHIY